jgi:hypothetical protein
MCSRLAGTFRYRNRLHRGRLGAGRAAFDARDTATALAWPSQACLKEISMTFTAEHISVSINRPAAQVYEFASNPENLPKWAAGLSGSIKKVDEDWIAESPMGKVKVKFAEKNRFGILDHDVTLPSGVKVYNPMRVFPNNDGSEMVFTLYRRPNVLDQEFAEDAKAVENDLAKLKTLLEK